jgi:hypothetical protein
LRESKNYENFWFELIEYLCFDFSGVVPNFDENLGLFKPDQKCHYNNESIASAQIEVSFLNLCIGKENLFIYGKKCNIIGTAVDFSVG